MCAVYGWLTLVATMTVSAGLTLAEESAVPLDQLPKAVTDAVKKMFPKAELSNATKEEDDGEIEYEVTVKDNGKAIDITVEADGTIESYEKEIDLKELPKAVTDALEKAHPKATRKSGEAVYEIENGKEELEYYEIQLKTAEGKEIEVKIEANGKILPDEDQEDGEADKK